MVFTKLSVQEKDAFFGLLDEYFQSRPELFAGKSSTPGGLAGTGISTATATSVVQRAFAVAPGKPGNPSTLTHNNSSSSVDVAQAVNVGRVAAASLAFSQAGRGLSAPPSLASTGRSPSPSPSPFAQLHQVVGGLKTGSSGGDVPPPTLPRRTTPTIPASAPVSEVGGPGSEVDKLVTRKTSVFSGFKKPSTGGGSASIPSAFVVPKNSFGPPPVRRTTSETSTGAGAGVGVGATRAPVVPPPQRQAAEEAAEGEWAEVLYDYSSEDPGDLTIEAGKRVLVTARSSEDWWTGQVDGQGTEGLFPASYVQLS